MNKYQEALGSLWSSIYYEPKECILERRKENEKHLKTLQELVDKATPKKMEKIDKYEAFSYHKCPVCYSIVGSTHKYCSNCGQRIDTIVGDEDEYGKK